MNLPQLAWIPAEPQVLAGAVTCGNRRRGPAADGMHLAGLPHRAEPATALRYSGSLNRGSPIASRRARRRDDGDLPGEFLLSSAIWALAALTSPALVFACPPRPHPPAGAPGSSAQVWSARAGSSAAA